MGKVKQSKSISDPGENLLHFLFICFFSFFSFVPRKCFLQFSISFYKDKAKRKQPLKADLHPLAYLLMICDELQCWDRTAYGRNSRTELQPMAVTFDFSGNAISAVYHYDREEQEKIDLFSEEYRRWEEGGDQGKPPRLWKSPEKNIKKV